MPIGKFSAKKIDNTLEDVGILKLPEFRLERIKKKKELTWWEWLDSFDDWMRNEDPWKDVALEDEENPKQPTETVEDVPPEKTLYQLSKEAKYEDILP